jgi:hypothetical protein
MIVVSKATISPQFDDKNVNIHRAEDKSPLFGGLKLIAPDGVHS